MQQRLILQPGFDRSGIESSRHRFRPYRCRRAGRGLGSPAIFHLGECRSLNCRGRPRYAFGNGCGVARIRFQGLRADCREGVPWHRGNGAGEFGCVKAGLHQAHGHRRDRADCAPIWTIDLEECGELRRRRLGVVDLQQALPQPFFVLRTVTVAAEFRVADQPDWTYFFTAILTAHGLSLSEIHRDYRSSRI